MKLKKNSLVVICWKIRIFAYWTTPKRFWSFKRNTLWFAEKFVSLLIEQHQQRNNGIKKKVVICWKIRIFAYWTTPSHGYLINGIALWFAEKFVSLLIEQHLRCSNAFKMTGCDLLKNSYLCLLNNTKTAKDTRTEAVVICWKIRIFAYWTTPRVS